MLNCLEFAAYTTFMMKFGTCYMPDYALHFIDSETNFEIYYGNEYEHEREEYQQKSFYEKQKKAFLSN